MYIFYNSVVYFNNNLEKFIIKILKLFYQRNLSKGEGKDKNKIFTYLLLVGTKCKKKNHSHRHTCITLDAVCIWKTQYLLRCSFKHYFLFTLEFFGNVFNVSLVNACQKHEYCTKSTILIIKYFIKNDTIFLSHFNSR